MTLCHLCDVRRKALFRQFDGAELDYVHARKMAETDIRTRADVVEPGTAPGALCTVLSGWAFVHRRLADGGRQILDFLLPGDLIDMDTLAGNGYGVRALTALTLCRFDGLSLAHVLREQPGLCEGFAVTRSHDERRLYERLASLGRRSAAQRLAHLMLEITDRVRARGMDGGTWCPFPLQRQHMADALGLSGTQVNRSLAELRDQGLATVGNGALVILDRPGLEALADYAGAAEAGERFIL
ncbi:MAG TPA: Crp/Fnr family transcriptional regulator [Azospirillum sp.]|nr:Crp/Fnr family transcriptional regulator [Azospirillum sp.]